MEKDKILDCVKKIRDQFHEIIDEEVDELLCSLSDEQDEDCELYR